MRVTLVLVLAASTAAADPLRLRADALATTSSPAGLVTLDATGDESSTLSAEAVVWMADRGTGDVLVMAIHGHTRDGTAIGTVGRFVASLGALRPIHLDGARGRIRLPHRFDVEAYAGVPVVPGLSTPRAWDWAVGARASRRFGDWGSAGIAYGQEREAGLLVGEEAGVDAGAALGKHEDVAAKLAYDLANPGLAEATLTASDRHGSLRTDLFASYRAASHLLPATSLFSVLGDVPAERAGTTLTWRAAPRLDLGGDLGVRHADDATAPEIVVRARLRLDDRGTSSVSAELRRDGVGDSEWTGARGAARIALPCALVLATELELVLPDHAPNLGVVWPWALVAISSTHGAWDAAIALEASASPQDRDRLDALAQLTRRWELR